LLVEKRELTKNFSYSYNCSST